MGIEDVLNRVEGDLANGHTFVAIQRLTTLVQANPKDLDLRSRLAQVHLSTGNLVEAGRWFYLSEGADSQSIAAFEKAIPHPRARLRALRWGVHDPESDPQPGRDVISQLHREAAVARENFDKCDDPATYHLLRRKPWYARVEWRPLIVLLAFIAIFVIGLVTVVGWILPG